MKICAIGDFHGKFPMKLYNRIKKEKVDLIVSLGDYLSFFYRKLWFKHCYGKDDIELWHVIGKKKFKELELKNVKSGERPLKMLSNIGFPVITITGNLDKTKWNDIWEHEKKIKDWLWPYQDFFTPLINKFKNIKSFDFSYFKFGKLIFLGLPRSSYPGRVKSKEYRKQRKKMDKLFKRFKNERIIFVSHNVPYNTKLDKITVEDADKKAKGKHYGSKLARRLINTYKPFLVLGGHIHEHQGKDKIGISLIVNPGAAVDGKAAIINLPKNKKEKIKVKFIK